MLKLKELSSQSISLQFRGLKTSSMDLPEDVRVCQQHDEPVVIREREFLPNQGPAAPFAKAAFVGCCDAAIVNVLSAIGAQSLMG